MKKNTLVRTFLLSASILLFTLTAPAQLQSKTEGEFAAGVILGAPTGFTGKLWLDGAHAVDMGIAFSLNDYVLLYGDYLVHKPRVFGDKSKFTSELDFYYGLGGALAATTKDRDTNDYYLGKKSGSVGIAIRVPFGVEWRPHDPPVGVFVELVPGMSIVPATSVIFHGGIGARYYF